MKITPQRNAAFLTFVRELTAVIYQQHFLPCKSVPREQAVQSDKLPIAIPRRQTLKDDTSSLDILEVFCAIH